MKRFYLLSFALLVLGANSRILAQTNGAQYVSQSIPQQMQPGERKSVAITMKNIGTTSWTQAGQYKLGTQSPQDNTLWMGGTRVYLTANESISLGQNKTFTFEITAPITPGTYNFQWRMVQDDVAWFGEFTPLTQIVVVGNSQSVIFPVRLGLWPASDEESNGTDLDGDGISQIRELQLAQAFFPTIWFDNGEDLSAPGGNHNHDPNQPGRLVFRARPHPENPRYIAITYAMLFAQDGGETYGPLDIGPHRGDVETFAITLAPNPLSKLGYGILAIRTWAHEGTFSQKTETDTLYARGLYGFSVDPVGRNDIVLVSENKHGSYLHDNTCDRHLGFAENCDLDFTLGDINAWVGFNAGERDVPRHIDLGPLGFPGEQMWTGKSFTGGLPPSIIPDIPYLYPYDKGAGLIEEKLELFAPAVHAATNAGFVSQSVPLQMQPGETKSVSITMQNTGKLYWCPEIGIKLGSQNPQDNAIWTGDSRIQLPPGTVVQPGDNYTFTFQITAPKTPGVYNFQWHMLQEDVIWFGDFTPNVAITVVPKPAYTLAASPSPIAPGGQLTVTWTAPSGSSSKDWIGLCKVGAPNTSFLWWSYTNGATSGSFTLNAPTTPGQYEFRYFLNNGFTEATRSNVITVTPVVKYWLEDTFENLVASSLAGQNGWAVLTGVSSASVIKNPAGSGQALQLDPAAGQKSALTKNIAPVVNGTHIVEFKVLVEPGNSNSASMAKLEVNTTNGAGWDKKFQIYFGVSMRLNYSPNGAVNFISQTAPNRWYQVKTVFNLGANLLDLYLDGALVLDDVAIGAGAISGITLTGFDSPGYVLLDDIRGYAEPVTAAKFGSLSGTQGSAGLEETAGAVPASFTLTQNYPNPFWSEMTSRFAGNPETIIQYAIPQQASEQVHVTLCIYNVYGQVVRTLVDAPQSPGYYHALWDGKNDVGVRVASGTYLYTIVAGELRATKRMTILK